MAVNGAQRRAHVDQQLAVMFGERLLALRRFAEMTQQDIADAAGVTRSSIANIEAGRQGPPTVAMAALVAAELGVDPGALVGYGPTGGLAAALTEIMSSALVASDSAGRLWDKGDSVEAIRLRGVAEGLTMASTKIHTAMTEARAAWAAAGLGTYAG